MKTRTIMLTLAAVFAAIVVCFAADVNVGSWKVNAAKSKNLPSDDKNTTIANRGGCGGQHESHPGRHRRQWQTLARRMDGQVRWQRLPRDR